MKKGVFAGSFDPVTKGHEAIIKKACTLFDQVIVGIGTNTTKNAYFSLEKRMEFLQKTFEGNAKVLVIPFSGLTIDFCREQKAEFIIRGLRSVADFEYEKNIAQMNRAMAPDLDTVFFLTDPSFSAFTSTIVREILRFKGDVSPFVPDAIADLMQG
jgi:pantetheine-phosphate adenylyltransferase